MLDDGHHETRGRLRRDPDVDSGMLMQYAGLVVEEAFRWGCSAAARTIARIRNGKRVSFGCSVRFCLLRVSRRSSRP